MLKALSPLESLLLEPPQAAKLRANTEIENHSFIVYFNLMIVQLIDGVCLKSFI
jgi:hypothetical protein